MYTLDDGKPWLAQILESKVGDLEGQGQMLVQGDELDARVNTCVYVSSDCWMVNSRVDDAGSLEEERLSPSQARRASESQLYELFAS